MAVMKKQQVVATFSIVARDSDREELGIAVQSKFLAVGALVPWAQAGVGALATQSWANTSFGPDGLALLKQGHTAQEALDKLLADDDEREYRQVGIVAADGGSATFTGSSCFAWAGGVSGPDYCCQGNILVGEDTVLAMEKRFLSSEGDLAQRLLAALAAGGEAGGDSRGKQAAALLVVKEGAGYGGFNDRYVDLRVDDHPEPIHELIRLHKLYQLYFYKTDPERLMAIEGERARQIGEMLTQLGYRQGTNVGEWSAELQAALKQYYLIENFDERMASDGFVDGEVFDFMCRQVQKSQLDWGPRNGTR